MRAQGPQRFDGDLAADLTRTANRLRDALTAVSPALDRTLGPKLDHPGVRRLLAAYPTPSALREAGADRIRATVAEASPRMADKVTAAVDKTLVELALSAGSARNPGRRDPARRQAHVRASR